MRLVIGYSVLILAFWGCGTDSAVEDRRAANRSMDSSEQEAPRSGEGNARCLEGQCAEPQTEPSEVNPFPEASSPAENDPPEEPIETLPPMPTPDPAAGGDPNVIVFRILNGIGGGSWNSSESRVTARIGQILRVVNDDSQDHRLHTNGSPCPHGPRIQPGQQFDCAIQSTYDPDVSGPLYDHMAGPEAEVWFEALPAP